MTRKQDGRSARDLKTYARKDIAGRRFGKLTAIRPTDRRSSRCVVWECRCDCGGITFCNTNNLSNGTSASCGCVLRNKLHLISKTHGQSKTKLYDIWLVMRDRCRNPRNKNYHRYGGRGIFVCKRWDSFVNFAADMGEPGHGDTLDRIDNDGPYSPENCRWASRAVQGINRSCTFRMEVDGTKYSANSLAAAYSLPRYQVYKLAHAGMNGGEIVGALRNA